MAEAAMLGSVPTAARAMFLMLTPNESSFERLEDVHPYVQQVGIASLALTSNTCVALLRKCQTGPPPAPLHFRATRTVINFRRRNENSYTRMKGPRWTTLKKDPTVIGLLSFSGTTGLLTSVIVYFNQHNSSYMIQYMCKNVNQLFEQEICF